MAYHSSYEGCPITDDVVMDAQCILDDISQLEADHITEDFLCMKIHHELKSGSNGLPNSVSGGITSMSIDVEHTRSADLNRSPSDAPLGDAGMS